jgi:hypothetical protein
MVLTFTLTAGLSVAEGPEGVRQLLIAAIGCNFAWGIIDGVFYIMGALFERGRLNRLSQAVRQAPSEAAATAAIATALDGTLGSVSTEGARRTLYVDIARVVSRSAQAKVRVTRADILGALASFWLVVLSTIPAALPFVIFNDRPRFALRVSNGLLLGMLFFVGHRWGKYTGGSGWLIGLALTLVGGVLVAIAVALGG